MASGSSRGDHGNIQQQLVVTVGLPGSGKSTWAQNWVSSSPTTRYRVNRDDIRAMLLAKPGVKTILDDENLVTSIQNSAVEAALSKGYDVVVDNTNLRRKAVADLDKIALKHGVELSVKTFVDVPLETCLQRNDSRSGDSRVPDEVIENMYTKFVKNYNPYVSSLSLDTWSKYVPDNSLPSVYLVDIDGTVATMGDRSPYDESRVFEDTVNEDVVAVVSMIRDSNGPDGIVFMSGRSEDCRKDTTRWLEEVGGFTNPTLFMRKSRDTRKDSTVKHELFNEHIRDNYCVKGVFDDRAQVVAMWRAMGLTVFQVADGDF